MASIPDHDPFFYDGPIRARGQFFGRNDVVSDLLYYLLESGQSISIIGHERIGKTSLLLYVAYSDTVAEIAKVFGFRPRKHVFAYIDCESMMQLNEAGCFRRIREALEEQVIARGEHIASRLNSVVPSDTYSELCDVLRILKKASVQPVVGLDDFEWLAENSHLGSLFFNGLRALNSNYDVVYLTTSRVSLDVLERRALGSAGSPFFNIFLPYELSPFDPEESHKFLESRLVSLGVALPEAMRNQILELSRHEPYLLQVAGACVYRLWCKTAGKLGENHCKDLEILFNEALSSGGWV